MEKGDFIKDLQHLDQEIKKVRKLPYDLQMNISRSTQEKDEDGPIHKHIEMMKKSRNFLLNFVTRFKNTEKSIDEMELLRKTTQVEIEELVKRLAHNIKSKISPDYSCLESLSSEDESSEDEPDVMSSGASL